MPQSGTVIYPQGVAAIDQVLARGCWSHTAQLGLDWQARVLDASGQHFAVSHRGQELGQVRWSCIGEHNVANGLSAIAAAYSVGVAVPDACAALGRFKGVKRRMELLADVHGTRVYDDFAHHPTAIATTLSGLRAQVGQERITAVVELRSNTMKSGIHNRVLAQACSAADRVLWYQAGADHALDDLVHHSCVPAKACASLADIVATVACGERTPEHVVVMSNGGFGGVHGQLIERLQQR